MPFVNESQRKACYAQQRRMNEQGLVAAWDCREFGLGVKKSPKKITKRKSAKRVKATPKKVGMKNGEQVFQGVKGGKFVIRKNKKVYV